MLDVFAVPEAERDPFLPDKLAAEHPAILRWAIDGALAWRRIGLSPPAAVLAARDAHLAAEDALAPWLDEHTEPSAGEWASAAALYRSWRGWCRDAGEDPGSQKRFSHMLKARGYEPKRRRTGHHGFLGLRVRPEPALALVEDRIIEMAERMRAASSVIGDRRPPSQPSPAPFDECSGGGRGSTAPFDKPRVDCAGEAGPASPANGTESAGSTGPAAPAVPPSAGPSLSRAARGRGADDPPSVIRHHRAGAARGAGRAVRRAARAVAAGDPSSVIAGGRRAAVRLARAGRADRRAAGPPYSQPRRLKYAIGATAENSISTSAQP